MPSWFSGCANNWIRSGSGMGKYSPYFVLEFLFRPLRVLAAQEGHLMPPHRPVKPVRCLPALLRSHVPKHLNLFRTCFFIRQHEKTVRRNAASGKRVMTEESFVLG